MSGWVIHCNRFQVSGTTEEPHRPKDLCATCYRRRRERELRDRAGRGTGTSLDGYGLPIPRPGNRSEQEPSQTAESVLRTPHLRQQLSLQAAAEHLRCSRQYTLRLLKKYGIPRRALSLAQRNAQRDARLQSLGQHAVGHPTEPRVSPWMTMPFVRPPWRLASNDPCR
jgi:hypothetical protein